MVLVASEFVLRAVLWGGEGRRGEGRGEERRGEGSRGEGRGGEGSRS